MNSIAIILKNYKNGNLTLDESVQLLKDINKYPYYPYYYSTSESGKSIPVEFTTCYTYD